jgi:hypothetical protein
MPLRKCALSSPTLSIADCETNRRIPPAVGKLPAAHDLPGNTVRLQPGTLGRRMGGKIADEGDRDVVALVGVTPFPKWRALAASCI